MTSLAIVRIASILVGDEAIRLVLVKRTRTGGRGD
jgi:hypothetical protein